MASTIQATHAALVAEAKAIYPAEHAKAITAHDQVRALAAYDAEVAAYDAALAHAHARAQALVLCAGTAYTIHR